MKNIFNYFRERIPSIFSRQFVKYSKVLIFENTQAFDQEVLDKHIVLVGGKNNTKWAHFLCPCGCGEQISVNLMKSYYPRWRVIFNEDSTVSIKPSVDNTSCGSHFWIEHNKVLWAKYSR